MSARVHHCIAFFVLFLVLSSGSSVEKMRLPEKAIKQSMKLNKQENQMLFSSSYTTIERDIPTINPTPITETPTVNPTPPAAAGQNPTPTTTPTTPATTPTTPATTPTTPATTPTTPATTPTTTTPTSSSGAWCIASPTASQTALQVALDYACGYGEADCSAIQSGGSCYNPNTVRDHASYAFNDYYQKNPVSTSCVFGGTAELTYTDPGSGNCHYASPRTSTSMSPPVTPTTPTTQSPPSPITSTTPTGGATVYGAEPTGSPSMAASTTHNLLLLFSTKSILMYILTANHI